MKGKPKHDGSGKGTRDNKGRGECEILELFGKGKRENGESIWK